MLQMSKKVLIDNVVIVIAMVVLLVSCSSDKVGRSSVSAVGKRVILQLIRDMRGVNAPVYLPTQTPGVYAYTRHQLYPIHPGRMEQLYETNAKRGFAFRQPFGKSIIWDLDVNEDHESEKVYLPKQGDKPVAALPKVSEREHDDHVFYVIRSPLELATLQLTHFRGRAVLSRPWSQEIKPGYCAWIADETVPLDLKMLSSNTAVLKPRRKLAAGFYIIHDRQLFMGKKVEEVTAYYPLIITDKSRENPWIQQAQACIDALLDIPDCQLAEPSKLSPNQLADIRECAVFQHLMRQNSKLDPTQKELINKRLMLLEFLNTGLNEANFVFIRRLANTRGHQLERWLWFAFENHTIQMLVAQMEGKPFNDLLATYYLKQRSKMSNASWQDLTWVIFDSGNTQRKQNAFEQILEGKYPRRQLYEALIERAYLQLRTFAQHNQRYEQAAQRVERQLQRFGILFDEGDDSAKPSPETTRTRLVVGPASLNRRMLDEDNTTLVSIRSKKSQLLQCYQRAMKKHVAASVAVHAQISIRSGVLPTLQVKTVSYPSPTRAMKAVFDTSDYDCMTQVLGDVSTPYSEEMTFDIMLSFVAAS